MNKNDLRFIKTEDNIRDAFKTCVQELGFQQTHISDICKKARISRNTFYAHYLDKYDLLDTLFKELQLSFNESFTDEMGDNLFNYEFDSSILWYMNTIARNHEYYKLLLECSYDKFLQVALDTIIFIPMRKYSTNFDEKFSTDLKFQLNVNYMFQGMITFTKIWLDNYDCITLQEAIEEMKKLCIGPVSMFIEKISQ